MAVGTDHFVFGIDLDGVVADFHAGIKMLAAEWLGVEPDSLTDNVSYGFGEWGLKPPLHEGDPSDYDRMHRWAVTNRDLFADLQPLPGAPQALRSLSSEGIRIRVITHRLFVKYTHQKAIMQTIQWLDRWDIPYWDLCFMRHKDAVDADIYVEDSPTNIEVLQDTGRPVIVYSNSTNRDLGAPLRADSWEDVERIVREHYARWLQQRGITEEPPHD